MKRVVSQVCLLHMQRDKQLCNQSSRQYSIFKPMIVIKLSLSQCSNLLNCKIWKHLVKWCTNLTPFRTCIYMNKVIVFFLLLLYDMVAELKQTWHRKSSINKAFKCVQLKDQWKEMIKKAWKRRKNHFPQKPNSMTCPNFCVSVLMYGKYKFVRIVTPQG